MLARSTSVRIEVEGGARELLRCAKTRGLIALVPTASRVGDVAVVELVGPRALPRHRTLYARALAGVLPTLRHARRWHLRARLVEGRGPQVAEMCSGDPLPVAERVNAPPSPLSRLVSQLARRAPLWEVRADPDPIDANGALVFPDLLVTHRLRGWRVPVEILGFWTADGARVLRTRLAHAGIEDLLVCVDEERNCGDVPLPDAGGMLRFRRKLDPAALLRAIEERAHRA